MDKFLYNATLGMYNGARRIASGRWINPGRFNINVPDERMNRTFRLFTTEVEERLSLPFGLKLRTRWLRSSENRAESYVLESSLAAEMIAYYDPELAFDILNPFLENQTIEGNIPMYVRPLGTSRFSAGPYLFNALWKLSLMEDIRNAGKLPGRMSRLANWLVMHKKNVEGLFSHKDSEWFRTAPCLAELRMAQPGVAKEHENIRSVAFNSLVAMQMRMMSKLARKLGSEGDAKRYEEVATELTERINETFWDGENGFYCDLAGDSVIRDISLGGFLTLAGEIPNRGQAVKMAGWLPVVSDRRAMLNSNPGMAPIFRLVVEGLLKYGMARESAGAAVSVIEHIAELSESEKYFLPRAVALLLLIEEVAGFNKFADRYVLYPKLPERWAEMPVRIFDGDKDLRINLMLRKDGAVSVMIAGPSGMLYEKNIPNYSFVNIFFPLDKTCASPTVR